MYSIKWSFGGLKRIMKSAQLIVSNFGYLKRIISELNFGVRIFCLLQYVRLQVRFADSIHKLYYFMSNFVFKTFFYQNAVCGCLSLSCVLQLILQTGISTGGHKNARVCQLSLSYLRATVFDLCPFFSTQFCIT